MSGCVSVPLQQLQPLLMPPVWHDTWHALHTLNVKQTCSLIGVMQLRNVQGHLPSVAGRAEELHSTCSLWTHGDETICCAL